MKTKGFLFICTVIALLMSACSENETDGITLTTYGTTELYSVTNQSADIKFNVMRLAISVDFGGHVGGQSVHH